MRHGKYSSNTSTKKNGFTLVELLVVLVIVALLLSLVIPRYTKSITKAQESALKSDLTALRLSIDRYFADKGSYPTSLDQLVTEKYIRNIPVDPMIKENHWDVVYIQNDDQQQVYDVKSTSPDIALDGTKYHDW